MNRGVKSIIDAGFDGFVIYAECHFSNSLPAIVIVGLGSKAVDEAKERLRSAFDSSHIQLPRKRITINLAPADIPKESTSLDMAIAAAIMQTNGEIKRPLSENDAVIGELGLDGSVRPVRGVIGKLLAGQRAGIKRFMIPQQNLNQAMLVPGITVVPVKNIRDLYLHMNGQDDLAEHQTGEGARPDAIITSSEKDNAMTDVVGQQRAKRALTIAAAGGHNILLIGPPGTGKSMLAKGMPSIMPELNQEEMLEVTHLHSLTGGRWDNLVFERPFRAPHHSASHISIVGGGHNLRPGEISLAHRGVLFVDELPEFRREALEALRQPLEDRSITVARAKDTVKYPAHFILIATANPCPCGYWGTSKACQCSAQQIMRYRQKLSGPIMDRVDLHVEVAEVEHEKLLAEHADDPPKESDDDIRRRVANARKTQIKRYGSRVKLNAEITSKDIKTSAGLTESAREILNQAAKRLDISARSYMKAVKVARTIADLNNSTNIEVDHIAEALSLRPQMPSPL